MNKSTMRNQCISPKTNEWVLSLFQKVKMSFLLIHLLSLGNLYAQNYSTFNAISNPNDFQVVSDSVLLIYDMSRQGEELCLTNIYSYQILNCTRLGKGPGEFSGNAIRILINRKEGEIYLWDYGSQRVSRFSDTLEYIEELRISEHFRGALAILPLNESYQLYMRMNKDSFSEIVNLQEDSIHAVVKTDHEFLLPVKENFLLKQGNYTYDAEDESITFTSQYASIIMKISVEGLDFLTLGEPGIPFPERDKNDEYGIPSIHDYTTSSVNASIYKGKIFILHSGKSTNYKEAFWYLVRGRILELQEKLVKGKELLIYSSFDGQFIESLDLPFEAIKAKVFNNKIYVLHDTHEGVVLSVIPKEGIGRKD